jgi:hypothetical protein
MQSQRYLLVSRFPFRQRGLSHCSVNAESLSRSYCQETKCVGSATNPFIIRSYVKRVRNPRRMNSYKNKGLKVPVESTVTKNRGAGGGNYQMSFRNLQPARQGSAQLPAAGGFPHAVVNWKRIYGARSLERSLAAPLISGCLQPPLCLRARGVPMRKRNGCGLYSKPTQFKAGLYLKLTPYRTS